jgi:predicted nucleotidyltransferase
VMNIQAYLDRVVTLFAELLDDRLVGVYLHGSLAMHCFNPETSDVDLLVVVKRELTDDLRKNIISKLLICEAESYEEKIIGRPHVMEMSIVLECYLENFVYPTPFELHYFHQRYLMDEKYICGGEGFTDPDLAGHIVVTYHRGITLYGCEIKHVFRPINSCYYIESIYNDIKEAPQGIADNPIYYTLNLCRVLHYLQDGQVSSKREGGEWALTHLPQEFKKVVNDCLNRYNGLANDEKAGEREFVSFAQWMLKEINRFKPAL